MRFAIRHLLVDQPEVAHDDITDALASWQPSAEAFGNQSAWALWTRTRVILYQREFGKLHEVARRRLAAHAARADRPRARAQERVVPRVRHVLPRPRDRRARSRSPLRGRRASAPCCGSPARSRPYFPGAPAAARMLEAGVACVRGGDVVTPLRIALDAAIDGRLPRLHAVHSPPARRSDRRQRRCRADRRR